jgi:YVTN family beta-propeller protein
MKPWLIALILIGILCASILTPAAGQNNYAPASPSQSQGYSPFAIAITADGQYAYLSFDLSEEIFKVRLSDLSIVATLDLSVYFPIECEHIALDSSETKLFVFTPTWHKLLVVDTGSMSLAHVIDNYSLIGMSRSKFGTNLITWDGGPTVRYVDTNTYAVTQLTSVNLYILKIKEDQQDPSKWYLASQGQPGGQGPVTVGLYDWTAKTWINSVTLSLPEEWATIMDFQVIPSAQKAYLAFFGGWSLDFHAYGWLTAINLQTKQVTSLAIDGGAMCLQSNAVGSRLFVGTGWPEPNTNNLLVVNTTSDSITGSIPLGQNAYGWHYTQMNDLQLDPVDPNLLFATSADGNAFLKINIDSQMLTDVHVLNRESMQPHLFARRQGRPFGNVMIQQSAKSFELNLNTAAIQKLDVFPAIRQDAYSYDIGTLVNGNILIAQGEYFLEVNPQNLTLVATHPLAPFTPSIWHYVLSKDKSRIYAITNSSGGLTNQFLAIDATTFQVETQLALDGGNFIVRPFEAPDGNKLYALGGMQNGAVVIQVIKTADYTIQKTITYDQPDRLGIATLLANPFAYDPASGTLFVGATQVVLAIDGATDTIKNTIFLSDVEGAIGLQPGSLTYINAVGLVYNPVENYLYIAHLDRSFISIYDLTNHQFLPKAIPLKGYFPNDFFADDSFDHIYSINLRSDNISVIDVVTKSVEKVIDLHDYLKEVYLPVVKK